MKNVLAVSSLLLFCILLYACKKDSKTDDPGTVIAPVFCNLANNTSSVNDTIKQIINDTSYATSNNTYYSQHLISLEEGISVDFEGGILPVTGTYSITKSFTEVIPGSKKCYVQYFRNGESFVGQAGKVEIGSGGSIYLCKINFKNTFGIEHTVSLKSLIN